MKKSRLKIKRFVVGSLQTNCYFLYDDISNNLLIIDPGDDSDFLHQKIKDLNLKPQAIIATHGHFDHLLAASELKYAYKIPFLMNAKDAFLLKRYKENKRLLPLIINKDLGHEKSLHFFGHELKVIKTPGHTPGSIALYLKENRALFVGDLCFEGGFLGRYDFNYSSKKILLKSLKKVLKFDANLIVYPGHGEKTNLMSLKNSLKLLLVAFF